MLSLASCASENGGLTRSLDVNDSADPLVATLRENKGAVRGAVKEVGEFERVRVGCIGYNAEPRALDGMSVFTVLETFYDTLAYAMVAFQGSNGEKFWYDDVRVGTDTKPGTTAEFVILVDEETKESIVIEKGRVPVKLKRLRFSESEEKRLLPAHQREQP